MKQARIKKMYKKEVNVIKGKWKCGARMKYRLNYEQQMWQKIG